MEAIYIGVLFQLCLTIAFSIETFQYKCGPAHKCTCYPDSEMWSDTVMNCSNKMLKSLGEMCNNLGNATLLDARENHINGTVQDDERIQGCHHLRYLSLRNNYITDIDEGVLWRMSKLHTLDVSHNKMDIFSQENRRKFDSLLDLEELMINGNLMNCLDSNYGYPDLSNNRNINRLHTDGLKNVSFDHSFSELSNLTSLFISGLGGKCCIENLSDNYFENLPNLQTLSLALCNISEIGIYTFTHTPQLKWLDLSQNRRLGKEPLFNVSYGLQFTNITFLNYSHVYETFGLGKALNKIDICFLRNTTLRELAVDGNRVETFETNSLLLLPSTLNIIHANGNKFTYGDYFLNIGCTFNLMEFYGRFLHVPHNPPHYTNTGDAKRQTTPVYLQTCSFMDDEYLQNISNQIEGCVFIKQGEKLSVIPSFPKNLRKVVMNDGNFKYKLPSVSILPLQNNINYIDVSGNVLYTWEGPIGPFGYLKYVDLSRNYCYNISTGFFRHWKWVENLQMHSNFIGLTLHKSAYFDVFRDLLSLKTLNLSLNKIISLHPQTFKGLNNLQTLDLSFNSLAKWTVDVKTMSNLTNVNLSYNAVQSLPVSLMDHLLEVSTYRGVPFSINLMNNELKYSCSNKDFLIWMLEHKGYFNGFQNYTFVNDDGDEIPTESIDVRVRDLDMKCRSYTVWIVISVIGVSVALSIIIGGILYRNRWKLRYFMYMSKQRFYGYVRIQNEEPLENYKYDAFISYAEENIRFVKDQIIPKVEKDGISLCIHQRDFLPGNAITDNIIDAIKSSRKTVILLTKAFLKRRWCIYEFNMARMESIYSRDDKNCIVIVMLENVPTKHMPMEMLDWIQKESYLEYATDENGEQLFWNSLADAIN